MSHWVPVATLADCPRGSASEYVVEGRVVALFNVEGVVYALDGVCPHQGGPLGKGALEGTIVTCPWHGWQFDVTSGQHQLSPSICHPALPARIKDDQILVDLTAGD
jgi:nitrite reductase (NADH) small subunit